MPLGLCATLALFHLGQIRTAFGIGWQELRLICEHLFELAELWIQVLFICSHFVWGLSMVMGYGFGFVPLCHQGLFCFDS